MSRYIDPPGVDSIAVGESYEEWITARHALDRLRARADQFAHGDAVSGARIYHEIKHDPHS